MAERRYSILLYTAVATAVVATFGVYRVLQNTKSKSQVATASIVVAAKDLPQGTALAGSNLTTKTWPAATVPAGAYRTTDSIVGRVTSVPVYSGEPIVPGRLAPVGVAAGLEVKVPPGKRAMAVRINEVAGINGLIQPNSRVDVVVMMRPTEATGAPVAKLFMENLRVLSMGTTVQRDADGKPLATATTAALEVTPEEAERLAIATSEGQIQLVLRGFGDPQTVTTAGARARDLVGSLAASPVIQQGEPVKATVTPRRETKRRTAAGEVALPPKVAPTPVPVVVIPPPPESVSVTIYRANQAERRSFVKPDTARKP